jgi:hypothetical protein
MNAFKKKKRVKNTRSQVLFIISMSVEHFFWGCLDPIDLIFYRERASQPARNKRRGY